MGHTPIRIRTIGPERAITFDLYIFYQQQYLLYRKNGLSLSSPLLKKLKKQHIADFYISDLDEINYQQYIDAILQEVATSTNVSVEEKVHITESATCNTVEQMQKNPTTEKAFNMTKKAARSFCDVITKNPSTLKEIFGRQGGENEALVKHCLNVCALSIKMAQAEGFSPDEMDIMAIAALLHDLGISQLAPEHQKLFFKPRKEFTHEEAKIYNTHPIKSGQLLQDKPYVSKEILDLMHNYGENLQGGGPLKKKHLSKMEEVLSLVNCYDKKMICYKMTHQQAIKDLMMSELGNYNLDKINRLKEILKKEGMA
ncbi:MAG: HD domain-containing phosphohydrolase [Pseudomonadota bacterium]